MGKFGKVNDVRLDPLAYNIGILGESGIGKSTLAKEVCEKLVGKDGYIALDIGREDGHGAIQGIVSESIPDWAKFAEVIDDIIENKDSDYPKLKTVVIDTYDELCILAEKEAIRQHNRKSDKKVDTINAAWGGYGKGLDKAIELMLDKLWELKRVNVGFILVAHTKKKDLDDVTTEEQYSVLTSNVTQKYFNAIKTKLHFLGLAYIDREIVKEKTKKKDKDGNFIYKGKVATESRVINFRDDTYSVDGKSRFADIIDKIPFGADEFIEAMQDAILAEQKKSGKDISEFEKNEKKINKEADKAAKEYSETKKQNKFDIEKNEDLIEVIKDTFADAEGEVKDKVKQEMEKYGIKNFKSLEISTEGLEKIVGILTQ
ncbi:ABC-type oligopeptide transport system ATPase subunit [Clostridiales Family XIII bacterium PM5-7]